MQDSRISSATPPEESFYGADFQEPEIHLRDYIDILLVRKWVVIFGFLAVMIPCLYYLKTTSPVYKATAVLLHEKQRSTPLLLEELKLTPSSFQVETGRHILKSPFVLGEIAARLNTHPGFNVAIEQLTKSISLDSASGTDILELSAEDLTPERATLIANTATTVYLEKTEERKRADLDQVIGFLEDQMTSVDGMLEQNERDLNAFREQYGLILQPNEGTAMGAGLLQQLGKMQQELLDTQTQVQLTKVQLESITELLQKFKESNSEVDSTLQTFRGNTFIQQLQGKIIDLQMALDTARQEYTDDSD